MYKVRVANNAQDRFPFPVFYLFLPEEVAQLRRAFDVVLCFQVRLYLPHIVSAIEVETTEDKGSVATLGQLIPDILSSEVKWQIGVPILTRKTGDGRQRPAFLGYTKILMKDSNHPLNKGVLEDFGYLLRGPDVITPPCLACPFILQHDAGSCRLGEANCYRNLEAYIEGADYDTKFSTAILESRDAPACPLTGA